MEEEKQIELLHLLEGNADLSTEDLAASIDESPEEVEATITEFEENHVIAGYHTMVNWDALPNEHVSAMIEVSVNLSEGVTYASVAESIYQYDQVEACYLMSGSYDFMVLTKRAPMHAITSFINQLATHDQVSHTTTHIVMQRYKDHGTIFDNGEDGDDRLVISQ